MNRGAIASQLVIWMGVPMVGSICWSRCTFDILVNEMLPRRLLEIIDKVEQETTCTGSRRYALLDGPFPHVMGWQV